MKERRCGAWALGSEESTERRRLRGLERKHGKTKGSFDGTVGARQKIGDRQIAWSVKLKRSALFSDREPAKILITLKDRRPRMTWRRSAFERGTNTCVALGMARGARVAAHHRPDLLTRD